MKKIQNIHIVCCRKLLRALSECKKERVMLYFDIPSFQGVNVF